MTDHRPTTETPGAEHSSTREIGDAVRRLSLQVDAYVAAVGRSSHHHPADLHATGAVKRAWEEGDPLTAGMLGQLLGLSPAAVTAMLGRMERAGHVRRTRGGPDGRRVYLEPGQRSVDDSRVYFAPLNDAYDRVLADYAPEHLAIVADVLARLERATDAAQHELGGTPTGDEPV